MQERLLETLQTFELYAVNSGFKKRAEHLITYKNGQNNTN